MVYGSGAATAKLVDSYHMRYHARYEHMFKLLWLLLDLSVALWCQAEAWLYWPLLLAAAAPLASLANPVCHAGTAASSNQLCSVSNADLTVFTQNAC